MRVKKLIQLLQDQDPNATVWLEDNEGTCEGIFMPSEVTKIDNGVLISR